MASSQTKPTRQLRELLQEEQEPFVVETYLSESAYTRNTSTPELSSGVEVSRKPGCVCLQRIKKGFQYSSKLMRSVYKKLVRSKKSSIIRNCNGGNMEETNTHGMEPSDDDYNEEEEAPSSSSSSTSSYEETESTARPRDQEQEQEQDSILTGSLFGLLVRSTTSVPGRVQVTRLQVEEEAPSTSLHDQDHCPSLSSSSSARAYEETESTARLRDQDQEQEEDSILIGPLLGLPVRSTTSIPGRVKVPGLQGEKEEEAPSNSLLDEENSLSVLPPSSTRSHEESPTKDHQQEDTDTKEEDSILTAALLGLLVRSTTRVKPGRVQVPGLQVEEEEAPSNSLLDEENSLSIFPPSSTRSHEESPTKDQQQEDTYTKEEDCILTASLLGLLVRSTTRVKPGRVRVHEIRNFVHCKTMLMQNLQLMLDCVREIIESFNGRRNNVFLGSEEIGELVLEKMEDWGKRSGDDEDIDMVLRDSSEDQWSDFRQQESEIVAAIGDEILEELENQLAMDMICGS